MQDQNNQEQSNIVEQHRNMLVLSGSLSDFQLNNLKQWPFIVFQGSLETAAIDYDFNRDSSEDFDSSESISSLCAGRIRFNLTFKKGSKIPLKEKQDAFQNITLWSKFLFWEDTEVLFYRDGKKWL